MSILDEPTPRECRRLPCHHGGVGAALAAAEAMLAHVAAGDLPALRWYRCAERAVVLGASQRLDALDLAACRRAGVAVYQRAAGGAAVLVDSDMLCLDVVVPRDDPLWSSDLTASYRWLGEVWTAALRTMGCEAVLVDVQTARQNSRDETTEARLARQACYGGLSPYEVTIEGRKVVGLAQVRRRQGALFQPAVLLRFDARCFASLLAASDRQALREALERRIVGLEEHVGHVVAPGPLIEAVEKEFVRLGLRPVDSEWSSAERETATSLLAQRYQSLTT